MDPESELKEIIINTICVQGDFDLEYLEFYTWLIWALDLCNS